MAADERNINNKLFKIGDVVSVDGEKGKIVDVYKPLGTYSMYKIQNFFDGKIITAARHQIIKGLPDDLFNFEELGLDFLNEISEVEKTCTGIGIHVPAATVHVDTPTSTVTYVADPDNTDRSTRLDVNIDCEKPSTVVVDGRIFNENKQSRFVAMSDSAVKEFVENNENFNTKKKTLSHIKLLQSFLKEESEDRQIHEIPPPDLDKFLSKFFVCVRQQNGNEYQPSYLRGILGSFERYLKRHRYSESLITGYNFSQTRECLKSKQKDLKKKGMGNRPMKADSITDTDIQHLYKLKLLGRETPEALLNTVWFNNMMHFGMRGGEEHRTLKWGDVKLSFDSDLNLEFLTFNERQTKTRTGENVANIRESVPAMYATPNDPNKCPVESYKVYSERRPGDFCGDEHPFYLGTITHKKNPHPCEQWFLRAPVGKNKLCNLMKVMTEKAGLGSGKRLTNTSVRKYTCQKLLDNHVPDTQAVTVTGHKNIQSLNNYRVVNNKQKQQMSAILANNVQNNVHTSQTGPVFLSQEKHTVGLSISQNTDPEYNLYPHGNIFSGCTIMGGTFNINIPQKSPQPKNPRKRPRVVFSDSD